MSERKSYKNIDSWFWNFSVQKTLLSFKVKELLRLYLKISRK